MYFTYSFVLLFNVKVSTVTIDFLITMYPIMNFILKMKIFFPRSKRGLVLYTDYRRKLWELNH